MTIIHSADEFDKALLSSETQYIVHGLSSTNRRKTLAVKYVK